MRNIRAYESWDNSEEENVEALSDILSYYKETILQFFDDRQMEADFVDVSKPDEFIVEYWPKSFDSTIPKKISYYLDELSRELSNLMKNRVDWNFSPNSNVQRIIFSLEDPIDSSHLENIRKLVKTKERLKYT
jgi:hypothetical protein